MKKAFVAICAFVISINMCACGNSESKDIEESKITSEIFESITESEPDPDPIQIQDIIIPGSFNVSIRDRRKDNYFLDVNDEYQITVYIQELDKNKLWTQSDAETWARVMFLMTCSKEVLDYDVLEKTACDKEETDIINHFTLYSFEHQGNKGYYACREYGYHVYLIGLEDLGFDRSIAPKYIDQFKELLKSVEMDN